jgi:serine/threonine protein kinase
MAKTPQVAPSLLPGQQIGGCRIDRMIGSGGMGEVYLADHLRLQRRVAVKTLRSDALSKERIARFVKEARTCARIDHPNVVTIHDVDQQAGLHFIVMQYVEGKDLDQLLKEQGGPLPWKSALRLIRLAAKGLHAVHQRGLVHRDIKPSNIMLSRDSRVLLMDFGLAREESHSDLTQMNHARHPSWRPSSFAIRASTLEATFIRWAVRCISC